MAFARRHRSSQMFSSSRRLSSYAARAARLPREGDDVIRSHIGDEPPPFEGELVFADLGREDRDGFVELQCPGVEWIRLGGDRRELPNPVTAQPASARSRRQAERQVQRGGPCSPPVLQGRPEALEIVGCRRLEQIGQTIVNPPPVVVGDVLVHRRSDQVVSDPGRPCRHEDDAAIYQMGQRVVDPPGWPSIDLGEVLDVRRSADDREHAKEVPGVGAHPAQLQPAGSRSLCRRVPSGRDGLHPERRARRLSPDFRRLPRVERRVERAGEPHAIVAVERPEFENPKPIRAERSSQGLAERPHDRRWPGGRHRQ